MKITKNCYFVVDVADCHRLDNTSYMEVEKFDLKVLLTFKGTKVYDCHTYSDTQEYSICISAPLSKRLLSINLYNAAGLLLDTQVRIAAKFDFQDYVHDVIKDYAMWADTIDISMSCDEPNTLFEEENVTDIYIDHDDWDKWVLSYSSFHLTIE